MGVPSGHLTCGSSTHLPLASSSSQIPSSSCPSTSVSETVLNNNQASLSQGAFDFCGKENKRQAEDMVGGDTGVESGLSQEGFIEFYAVTPFSGKGSDTQRG